ncbi:MAG: TIGR01777 family oxidoreductase [Verrucomicrobiota bacterium]
MINKKIIIAGGSGFIGRSLTKYLITHGFTVVILTRSRCNDYNRVRHIFWDGKTLGAWASELENACGIINLAGRNVDCRYIESNRRDILESRLNSVYTIGEALRKAMNPPQVWIQAATTAILGDAGDEICDESAMPGNGFSPDVARAWEKAFFDEEVLGVRKVLFRISFVLGRGGGALSRLKLMTKYFLGGAVGSGNQFYSWIHIADLNEMFRWAIGRIEIKGTYNATGLHAVRNNEFMSELRAAMKRPWTPRSPAWLVRLGCWILRTEPELALRGRNCVPKRFLEAGFRHQFPTLKDALSDLIT